MDMDNLKKTSGDLVQDTAKKAKKAVSRGVEELTPSSEEEERDMHREGPIARFIETQTARIPSDVFLWAGLASIGMSAALKLSGRTRTANFVGQWAPTILILGLYNKIVKVAGSDRLAQDRPMEPVSASVH